MNDLLVSTPTSKPPGKLSAIDRPARGRGTMAEIIVHARPGRSARRLHEVWGRRDPWEDRHAWACGSAWQNSDAEGVAKEGACK